MEKITKYVVVRFYKPEKNVLGAYTFSNFYVYTFSRGNKETVEKYAETLKIKYSASFQWSVMTEEKAIEEKNKYLKWMKQNERKLLDKKFPCRYIGKTRREEMAEMMTKR